MAKDLLLACTEAYEDLVNYEYRFVLGRKGKESLIRICIRWSEFIHLTGIQHLKDLPQLKSKHNKLIKDIKIGRINVNTLKESIYYKRDMLDIECRIKYLAQLNSFFRDCNQCFDYLNRKDFGSKISADWMITGKINNENCYVFLRSIHTNSKNNRLNEDYLISSFFPERGVIYGNNARQMHVLFKEEIHLPSRNKIILSCHHNFNQTSYFKK